MELHVAVPDQDSDLGFFTATGVVNVRPLTLCGLPMRDNYSQIPKEFVQFNWSRRRCPLCKNHPDLPLLVLADV